jgi:creatinine amidohydrolase
MLTQKLNLTIVVLFAILLGYISFPQAQEKALILQEMSWFDVQEYLKNSDMAIIPLGSTEQHGKHMPLGTDYYEAFGMCKMISEWTGVIVAPVLFVGYSEYHSGFPGTLSLKPETMEQVLFESVEMLIKYGFRRFMFFNYHGGNNIVQQKVIHRINHTTEATAIAVGIGGSIQKNDDGEFFDWHAGKSETSIMLYLKPELVKLERAEKPEIRFTPQVQELYELSKKYPELGNVASSLLGVPEETKKGGASHELSSNGVWSFSDPKSATKEIGQKKVEKMVETGVKFIEAWKQAKK